MELKRETVFDGEKIKLTFIETKDFSKYSPITQSYGLCYTSDLKLVMGINTKNNRKDHIHYSLPGGTVEKDEHPDFTLIREVDEELSLSLKKFELFGVLKVEFLNNPSKEPIYQLRYACLVDELKPLTLDPCTGMKWVRFLIDSKDFSKYLKWGSIGEFLAKRSEEIVSSWIKN